MMQSNTFIRYFLLLAGMAYSPQLGHSSHCANREQFDDFVQPFDESRKYRITSFDNQGNTSTRFPSMSSTLLRSPERAFLMIQKTSLFNRTFCEFYTLWKDLNGTLKGHYGLEDLGNDYSLRIVGFEVEKSTSRLLVRVCFTNNLVHGYTFELDSATPLDDGDFTGKVDLTEDCDRHKLGHKLYTPTPRDVRMVVAVGIVVGVFFLIQLAIGLMKVVGSKGELE